MIKPLVIFNRPQNLDGYMCLDGVEYDLELVARFNDRDIKLWYNIIDRNLTFSDMWNIFVITKEYNEYKTSKEIEKTSRIQK